MDPLPPLPPTNITPSAFMAAAAIASQPGYADSNESSPHSRHTDTWDDTLAQVPGAKLRIMCSYGGHIMPRPHDKSLCYVGGETRMVVIDRHSSLSSLSERLSQTLLSGRHFTLKYQLPNEELDSLISVTTDEDLENMVEEYNRIVSTSPLKPSRLRLFLFLAKPETAASMGCLLNDAKSETWFVDALNGSGLLPRGLSDSAVGACLLELDDSAMAQVDLEAQTDLQENSNTNLKSLQELQATMPDSPLVETGSSFGSSSSSPSMSNLPPIKVRADDSGAKFQNQMAGLDEPFSRIGISNEPDLLSAPPILPTMIANVAPVSAVHNEDERLDQGVVATGFRKPPLPLQPVQRKFGDGYNLPSPDSRNAGGFNLHSPDSIASDSSMGSAISLSKHAGHQETTEVPAGEHRLAPAPATSPVPNIQEQSSQTQVQQLHEHTYPPQHQQIQQQQYAHPGVQYIQAPMSSYYPVYAPPPPSQQQQPYHQIDQHHYPMYVLPVTQTNQTQVPQPYNYPIQANIADPTVVASSRPPPGPPQTNTIYRTANHFQQQYVPIQGTNMAPAGVNYGYDYAHPTNEQVYYTQHPVGQLPPQHQTMTAAMLAQASAQLPLENNAQQMRTTQPQ